MRKAGAILRDQRAPLGMSIHTIPLIQIVMPKVTRASAITLRVSEMGRSMRFYRDLLGLRVRYGGDEAYFSSLILDGFFLNLELSKKPETAWNKHGNEENKNSLLELLLSMSHTVAFYKL